jgi:hypothetical protein
MGINLAAHHLGLRISVNEKLRHSASVLANWFHRLHTRLHLAKSRLSKYKKIFKISSSGKLSNILSTVNIE